MAHFNPKTMKPDPNQFLSFVKGKLSESAQQSVAYRVVYNLFDQAHALYRNLDFVTSENISHLKAAGKTLTQRQKADAIALTALQVSSLRTSAIHQLVQEDSALSEPDRMVLEMALDLYKSTCEANYAALGNPRWIDEAS